jgi:hypothetical protein
MLENIYLKYSRCHGKAGEKEDILNIVMEKQGREKTTEVIAESAYEFLSLGRG